jgi:hypothetical protein
MLRKDRVYSAANLSYIRRWMRRPPNLGGCERDSGGAFFTSTVEDIGDRPWNTSISF